MRDHPGHDMPILAGMWGVKLSSPQMRKALQAVFYQMLHADSAYWRGQIISSRDQALLERYLWPWAKDITLQHDSYHCDLFAKSHPWPTRRQESETNNYVGAPFALNTTLSTACPVKCRPRAHPEWNLCWKYYSLHKPANRDWSRALEGKTNLLKGNLWPNSPQHSVYLFPPSFQLCYSIKKSLLNNFSLDSTKSTFLNSIIGEKMQH